MPGSVKSEAIVLRSLRYGEADRILHLYTPHRGRVSAIAKGVRKARSRFGGRLEPFFRVDAVLHEGRSELLTVTSVTTVAGHPRLREHGRGARRRRPLLRRGGPAVRHGGPAPRRLPAAGQRARRCSTATRPSATSANALAFRLKLLLAAGLTPQLSACASCGERDHLSGFSGAAGGVVCPACEAGSFRARRGGARRSSSRRSGGRWPRRRRPRRPASRQAERAVRETAEHHAHVRLRDVGSRN